ncbi:MAG: PIN domain-containing protein [Acidimicrobiia bacterium]|nr:PIN domain-containing protein [Acidimicrobiia bacterium]
MFVDTSAWYAAADSGDRSNRRAMQLLTEYAGEMVTSDHVLIETWYLTWSRLGFAASERLVNGIRMGIARVEEARTADLEVASAIHEAFPDQAFSIVDRTSWAVMERLGIHDAIAFDRDFSVYRFGPGRKKAFTVLS